MQEHEAVKRFFSAGWHWAAIAVALVAWSPLAARGTNLPRIDPSGQSLLVWPSPPLSKYKPEPGCPTHKNTYRVVVTPAKIIAPVGSEVVLLGSVCGPDGYMRANERVEWMLAPGGVGQFVTVGEKNLFSNLSLPNMSPRKQDNAYAIGTTSAKYIALTRGTPTIDDDIPVQKGQTWVTVTSPVEGATYVTAYAPSVFGWDQRQRTSTIYWVDAQWAFPPPASNPIGTRHPFTTTLTRQSDRSPLAGWIVRYEITGGPAAGFAPDLGQSVEVPTNALGQATAEIVQQQPAAGTNTIAIQIIRPGELYGSYGQRMVIGHGSTTKTWGATGSLSLRTTGPIQATIGSTAAYRIEISNPSGLSARQVVVTNPTPRGLTYISSNPPAQPAGGQLQWQLGDIGAGQTVVLEVNYRADQAGTYSNCAIVNAGDGLTAQSCATTTVVATAVPTQSVTLTMTAPPTAIVGQSVEFIGVIVNRGVAPTPPLVIVDRFDPGLQHESKTSPIERDIQEPLEPGQSRRIIVALRPTQPGPLCNTMEILHNGSVLATATACVTGVAQGGAAAPPPAVRPTIALRKTGPTRLAVGQTADFQIEITNTGQVPATKLRLADNYDPSLAAVMATEGHTRVDNDVVWLLDSLPPGRTVRYQVRCRCTAPVSRACNRATVTSAEGATDSGEACLEITPAAAPASTAKLTVAVADLVEPVGVNGNTTYEVKITNEGQAADQQVVLTAVVGNNMTPVAAGIKGPATPTVLGKTIRFAPIASLQPGEQMTFQIQAHADQPGNAPFRAQVTSAGNPAGVVADESTTVFAQ